MAIKRVERFRRNDYVGSPIWGIRTAQTLSEGDRVVADNSPFGDLDLVVGFAPSGRGPALACFYLDRESGPGRFCGFIDLTR